MGARHRNIGPVAAASALIGGLQTEAAVLPACGRSTVNGNTISGTATPLSAANLAAFKAVLTAYDATRVAFDAAFDLKRNVATVEALQSSDAGLAVKVNDVMPELKPGACRTSLETLVALENTQSPIRQRSIDEGKVQDIPKMITSLAECTGTNTPSGTFTAARVAVGKDCGIEA